jgi:hypothetical protein
MRRGTGLFAAISIAISLIFPPAADAALYSFTSHTFTTCGTTGPAGPTQAACTSAYSTSWDDSTSNFTVVSGIQYWVVPTTGRYYIDAYGAGGSGTFGGKGARIADTFDLTEGETIRILVGQIQTGTSTSANAGSGGTFVVRTPFNSNGSILVIAGGGAGAESSSSQQASAHATISNSGRSGNGTVSASTAGAGGTAGNGGGAATSDNSGGGGGGFFTNGANNTPMDNRGGIAFVNGGGGGPLGTMGNIAGGFGGGGASRNQAAGGGGAGGGGGYSGGGGGDNVGNYAGGGGGSYFDNGLNINRVTTEEANAAATAGRVTITFLGSPTISLSTAGSVTQTIKGQNLTLTAVAGQSGVVTFFADGKRIAGCISKVASPGNVTCVWKATVQKTVTLSANLVTNGSLAATTTSLRVSVNRRSTNR